MKAKSMVLLAVAVGCGLVAMLGVQQVLSGRNTTEAKNVTTVLVASAEIAPGVRLDETNTRFEEWPTDIVPEGAVTTAEEIDDRSLRMAVVINDLIMLAKLNEKGVHGASSEIPSGMRLITVPVNLTTTHSGLVMPGDRVDIVVTFKSDVGQRRNVTRTKTLLEYIEVFAADNIRRSGATSTDVAEHDAKNITLLVTPNQYNLCTQAKEMGQLTLALRRKDDDAIADAADADEDILSDAVATFGNVDDSAAANLPNGNLADFLRVQGNGQAQAQVMTEPVPPIVVEPSKWTVKIFAGKTVREEILDLPIEPSAEQGAVPGATPAATQNGTPAQGWLKSFITGA